MMQNTISPIAVRWMRFWLLALGVLVYAMILIGGATRLTDSGLSITEWAPVSGALPPLSETAWGLEFEKYKQTAEYKLQNSGMSLEEFKFIFWWEWGHRLFGRLIGLIALVGIVIFILRGWLKGRRAVAYAGLIALGGLQGAIGWWMVASGIGETTRVDVAPYRLAVHFMLALLIIGLIAALWMDLKPKQAVAASPHALGWALVLLVGVSIQMASGALVAGLDAGRSYTDWPLMAGEIFPSNYIDAELGARSLFEGREATQFNHRFLAYVLFAACWISVWLARSGELYRDFRLLALFMSVQAVWGVLTLVNAAPMSLALLHQAFGVIVFLAAVRLAVRALRVYSPDTVNTDASMNTA